MRTSSLDGELESPGVTLAAFLRRLPFSPSLAHLLGHAGVGTFNLFICWACVAELVASVSILEVAPDCGHLPWDLKVAVCFCSDLGGMEERFREARDGDKCPQNRSSIAVYTSGPQLFGTFEILVVMVKVESKAMKQPMKEQ